MSKLSVHILLFVTVHRREVGDLDAISVSMITLSLMALQRAMKESKLINNFVIKTTFIRDIIIMLDAFNSLNRERLINCN